jgi:ATP-dependent RNA helicase DeaD
MTNFTQWELPGALLESLERMGITVPTSIQQETIPLALKGLDILASAQTGTGKTVAYLIPLIQKLTKNPHEPALILTPTRELAMQVHQTLLQMAGAKFKAALLIGGASMSRQFADLKKKPLVIVGTPGRINDHLERRSLNLNATRFLVIDEADRMLDMGFGVQLDRIAKHLPEARQTLLFSATYLPNIAKLSDRFLTDPQRVAVDTNNQAAPKIQQDVIRVSQSAKKTELLKQLDQREGSVIVFVKTRRRAESLSKELREARHNAEAMHGDLRQSRREKVIRAFRTSKSRILVATDVAARGLDIPHVMHVINYDLPECPEDYIHRIGRTGRAGAEGFALSLISPEDNFRWKAIERLLNPGSKERPVHDTTSSKQRHPNPKKKWRPKKFQHRNNAYSRRKH